ncbi:MAG: sigma-70 family RNA polymerase sigma factor [Phycisphaeraceae bacterium]|nr:sigma-70 family RNA polymerase sigma factor [Phycisphaeraceae bacterium]
MVPDAPQRPSGPRPEDASDEELARKARAGSSLAFAHLVRRYDERVYRFVRRWGLNAADAEDVTQESLVAAWQGLDRFDDRREFRPWLFSIASRRAATCHRVRARRAARDQTIQGQGTTTGDGAQSSDVWDLARRLLSEEACSALWLRYVEGMSAAQVAMSLGRTTVGVRVMLHRAKSLLAERIEPDQRPGPRPKPHGGVDSRLARADTLAECAP